MADMEESKLGLNEAAIRDLAQRLATHLREELGDRLQPLQEAFAAQRQTVSADPSHDGPGHP